MTTRQVSVRLVAEGGRRVRAELQGIGEAGQSGFRAITREVDLAAVALRRVAGLVGEVFGLTATDFSLFYIEEEESVPTHSPHDDEVGYTHY